MSKVASFGNLCVRAVLHLLGKEKMGREPKGFHDLKEIGRKFVDDLNSKGKKAECDDSKKDEGFTMHNLVDASASQVAMVQNDHMEVDKLYLGFTYWFACMPSDAVYVFLLASKQHIILEVAYGSQIYLASMLHAIKSLGPGTPIRRNMAARSSNW